MKNLPLNSIGVNIPDTFIHHKKTNIMKQNKHFMAMAAAVSFLLFSCQKDIKPTVMEDTVAETKAPANPLKENGASGYVYTLSNQTAGNKVLVYSRTSGGTLTYLSSYATGGTGTGGGLGNQGAVILSEDNQLLLAVNPGSNSVSSFSVSGGGLHLISTVSSGGTTPVSVTMEHDLVYVLNAGGSGNISGFNLHADGSLHAIAGSSRHLSSASAGAAQISFVADGGVVAITEKATNKIITYTINEHGTPDVMHSITSVRPTPFGFAVGKNGIIYVSEAVGGAPGASDVSSYYISSNGIIILVDGPAATGQTAACWVVVTNNGKYLYATNTGNDNISSFRAGHAGSLEVLHAIAATTSAGPIDAALSNNSKFLYVLNSGSNSIGAFSVDNDGSLSHIQNTTGLPVGATGMAAK
jgi:6-phosphogluconolactonase (cycloisomerase 2 family)